MSKYWKTTYKMGEIDGFYLYWKRDFNLLTTFSIYCMNSLPVAYSFMGLHFPFLLLFLFVFYAHECEKE